MQSLRGLVGARCQTCGYVVPVPPGLGFNVIIPCPYCGSPNALAKNLSHNLPPPEAIAMAEAKKPAGPQIAAGPPQNIGLQGSICKPHQDALDVAKEKGELAEKLIYREILMCLNCNVKIGA